MSVQVIPEAVIIKEAAQVLLENLSPSKVARFWASWNAGQGDYLAWRDEEFAAENVADLYESVSAFQEGDPTLES